MPDSNGAANDGKFAHVINLATQALLRSLSEALHFNPHDPDAHFPEGDAESRRDVIGPVGAIYVQERSLSQRKELFADIQNTMHESPSTSATANKTTSTAVLDPTQKDKHSDNIGVLRSMRRRLQLQKKLYVVQKCLK
ncbi:hypothetical protein SISNIDRAFT_458922 [Sistotremastrum niveocremeum HHB9708]|uniref:Uncharacterized protein n=1 Tax=Sistotremastrum niveocremeum HHB9708 TaxID=1314777 RepID=A0A164PZ95_9AGAM|nr:hypothetical protein SISNIDRAFT_458922 [Sistotremastrum niveocremeum HHB9708]